MELWSAKSWSDGGMGIGESHLLPVRMLGLP